MANKKVRDLAESLSPDRKFQSAEITEDVEDAEEMSYNSDLDDQDAQTMATNQVANNDPLDDAALVDITNDNTMDGENTQEDYDDTDKVTKLTASAEKEIEGLLHKIDQEKL